MNKKTVAFLGIVMSLVIAVIIYLSTESSVSEKTTNNIENNFQQVVHGVGIGATTKPTWCYINFDPRIDSRCPCIEWPIPGGYCYCPDHTGTVSYISGNIEMGAAIEIIRNR
ncbi:MAG TPA: hypothetical protein ACFYD7_06110 [Candidatus Wujingus californicus]|uniref:hypothetical protein n=2 Tax=Candidatus Wujingus californicus TaxID=3367618 RepID=UPI001D1ECE86|nr:hypothetical protein [Planctomycetota bacterium]